MTFESKKFATYCISLFPDPNSLTKWNETPKRLQLSGKLNPGNFRETNLESDFTDRDNWPINNDYQDF